MERNIGLKTNPEPPSPTGIVCHRCGWGPATGEDDMLLRWDGEIICGTCFLGEIMDLGTGELAALLGAERVGER